jgi:hypothetical protein
MTFTLKCQGNRCPCVSRNQGSHCSSGNRRYKPKGLVLLSQQQHHRTMLPEACARNWPQVSGYQKTSFHCAALLHYSSGAHGWEAGQPQNFLCTKDWFCHIYSSCHGSWKPMPQCKQIPWPLLPCGDEMIQACWLFCPIGTLNLLLSGRSLPPHA